MFGSDNAEKVINLFVYFWMGNFLTSQVKASMMGHVLEYKKPKKETSFIPFMYMIN